MKKKSINSPLRFFLFHLLLSLLLTTPLSLSAQVYPGSLTISSQAAVDDFSHTEITGNLLIQGNDITNLNALSMLKSVGGNLGIVYNEKITHIAGLSSLTSVGGELRIFGNTLLTNLDGLSSLKSVSGDLFIGFNSSLVHLDGLSALTSVGKNLIITRNSMLTNFDGLSALSSFRGNLHIIRNASLTQINGLSTLPSLGAEVIIRNNQSLSEFCGLYHLLNSGWTGAYSVSDNLANPMKADIIAGGPCTLDPAQIIADLLANGTLNQGQANALSGKINTCNLNAFNNQVSDWVNTVILTQGQANDLTRAAVQHCKK